MSLRDSFDMDGRVAVVTGSGRGIGQAIAWGLADFGCDAVVNAAAAPTSTPLPRGFATGVGGRTHRTTSYQRRDDR